MWPVCCNVNMVSEEWDRGSFAKSHGWDRTGMRLVPTSLVCDLLSLRSQLPCLYVFIEVPTRNFRNFEILYGRYKNIFSLFIALHSYLTQWCGYISTSQGHIPCWGCSCHRTHTDSFLSERYSVNEHVHITMPTIQINKHIKECFFFFFWLGLEWILGG